MKLMMVEVAFQEVAGVNGKFPASAVKVPPVNERPAPIVVAETLPVLSVRRREFGSVERTSAEVEAVADEL